MRSAKGFHAPHGLNCDLTALPHHKSAPAWHAARIALDSPEAPMPVAFGWTSRNWSGYALSQTRVGAFHSIRGAWFVPSVQSTPEATYSSCWIGIDGFHNPDLIQVGTEQDCVGDSTHYYAWWEVLPEPAVVIPRPVLPGDMMAALIADNHDGTWTIFIEDLSQGWAFYSAPAYNGPGLSAEWIVEAPLIHGRVSTLAHYCHTEFGLGSVNGGNPGLIASNGGVMIQHHRQVSTPSRPDIDTDGFAIEYGATIPTPPLS